jgi:hypothetical protein
MIRDSMGLTKSQPFSFMTPPWPLSKEYGQKS